MLIMKSYVHHKLQLHCEHKLINMVKQECVPNTKWSSQHSRNTIEKQAGQWFHTSSDEVLHYLDGLKMKMTILQG